MWAVVIRLSLLCLVCTITQLYTCNNTVFTWQENVSCSLRIFMVVIELTWSSFPCQGQYHISSFNFSNIFQNDFFGIIHLFGANIPAINLFSVTNINLTFNMFHLVQKPSETCSDCVYSHTMSSLLFTLWLI